MENLVFQRMTWPMNFPCPPDLRWKLARLHIKPKRSKNTKKSSNFEVALCITSDWKSCCPQVISCCPGLNQCWLIDNEVLWTVYIGNTHDISNFNAFENHWFKVTATSPRDQWVKATGGVTLVNKAVEICPKFILLQSHYDMVNFLEILQILEASCPWVWGMVCWLWIHSLIQAYSLP